MPLASSRSASLKRAQALEAEQKERKRMRKSLPSTFPSSLSVDETKTRQSRARRASLSKQAPEDDANGPNSENEKPNAVRQGPTPYWKVVKERGGDISPPVTRSTKKKKLPPRHEAKPKGVMLFSPPNQALNEKNEKERIKKNELEREKRIRQHRNSGNLLVFSPTHREGSSGLLNTTGVKNEPDSPEENDHLKSEETLSDLSSSDNSRGNNEQLTHDVRTLCEQVSEIVQSNRNAEKLEKEQQNLLVELAAAKAKSETLQSIKSNLEGTVESLQQEIRDIQAQRLSEKENTIKEMARRETEIELTRAELQTKIRLLDEIKSNYESKVDQLTSENIAAITKQKEITEKLQTMKSEYAAKKTELQQLSKEYEKIKSCFDSECQKNGSEKAELLQKLEHLQVEEITLQTSLAEYEERINSFENDILPLKESEIKEAKREMEKQEATIRKLNETVSELQMKLENAEKESREVLVTVETTRQVLKNKSQEYDDKLKDLQRQLKTQDERNRTLEQELREAHSTVEQQTKSNEATRKDFETKQALLDTRIQELEDTLVGTKGELNKANQMIADLKKTIVSLEEKLVSEAGTHALIQEQNSTVARSLERALENSKRLEGQNREKQSRITELERKLAIKEAENTDLREHVNEQKPREAALYHRLQISDEIRRELHAKVMQLMGNIRVFVRVRPVLEGETASPLIRFPGHDGSSCSDDITKKLVEVTEPKKDRGGLSDRRKKWKFAFDEVFGPNTSQSQVWVATEPLVQSAIDGFNVTIFAYGQTGSGKTHTLLGDGVSCRGLIGRSIDKLFNTKTEIEATSEGRSSMELSVEMLEVYNEEVRDMLAPGVASDGKLLSLKVNSQEVVGNEILQVESDNEILGILNTAQKRRCVKATASNSTSSRSHLLFTVNIKITLESGVERIGKLNICDLAGSERLDKSQAHIVGGSLLQESKAINKSLSVLSHVIEKLQAGSAIVPFRESKLTFLLRNSLTGDSKTLAIVCCSPVEEHHHETLCTLRFAEKANKVELNKAVAKFSC